MSAAPPLAECPVCRRPAAEKCRCPRGCMACAGGHAWYFCAGCSGKVVGLADHGEPADAAVCGECRAAGGGRAEA